MTEFEQLEEHLKALVAHVGNLTKENGDLKAKVDAGHAKALDLKGLIASILPPELVPPQPQQ